MGTSANEATVAIESPARPPMTSPRRSLRLMGTTMPEGHLDDPDMDQLGFPGTDLAGVTARV
jgi:hypothetical protein